MKNILVIHHYGGLGGAGKSLLINLSRLVKQAKVTVIVPKYPTDMYEILCETSGLNVIAVDYVPTFPVYSGGLSLCSPRLYLNTLKSLLEYSRFKKVIQNIPCDVIIANSIILCWLSLVFPNRKKVCFVRESKRSSLANIFIKKCLSRFNFTIFISQYDRKEWALKSETRVIENGSDIEGSGTLPIGFDDSITDGKLCLLFMGGTSYIKGFYHLVLSVLLVKNKNRLRLIILGDSRSLVTKGAKFIFKKFNVECLWYGKVKEISSFLEACHVLVFPVVKVHQGRPIFEAGAFKRPVIAPNFENLSEFVSHNCNGITYKKRSLLSLAGCVDRVIKGEFDLIALGNANYKMYLNKHSLVSTERKFNKVIADILQS